MKKELFEEHLEEMERLLQLWVGTQFSQSVRFGLLDLALEHGDYTIEQLKAIQKKMHTHVIVDTNDLAALTERVHKLEEILKYK